nr:GNAT family N-acetyltransferase [uncultured Chryseobacterium sp.]
MIIEKYSIKLKTVEEEDAELILDLLTDAHTSEFLSSTANDLELQKEWIKAYKHREKNGKEYYFSAIDEKNEKFATYRVYNLKKDICEIGSWVSKPGYSNATNYIKVYILVKDFVFRHLNYHQFTFVVHKENLSVVKYHKMFWPEILKETEEISTSFYQKKFIENRNRIFKNIK